MNKRLRIERLEAAEISDTLSPKASPALELYFKRLENERREQAGEQPTPLTPEEERRQRETDEDPKFRAYMERISQQRGEKNECPSNA